MSTSDAGHGADASAKTPPVPIRVALIDDQQLVRGGFRMLIDSQPDLTVVAEAGDGVQAVDLLSRMTVDVVLMDIRMPRMDGIEATRSLAALPTSPRVIVLTTFDIDEYVLAAIAAGASGFLLKDALPEEMLAAIRTVHAGDGVIAARSTRRLLQHVGPMLRADRDRSSGSGPGDQRDAAHVASDRAVLTGLTPREREVLVQMAYGASNKEIAARFVVSEATVKTHVGRVLAKTGSRDRVQAVVLAFRTGVVQPGELLRDANT
ncbi:MAG: response regulator transcription factor [Geodermatophilaceae bacterium]